VGFLFGRDISSILPKDLDLEYSRKTGKIKSFSIDGELIGTFRTDGGIALTIEGAKLFLRHEGYQSNCVVPVEDAVPFVSEGRSLFVKHVFKCGVNVKSGSDVAVIDKNGSILAVGRSLLPYTYYLQSIDDISVYNRDSLIRGIGVKVREGIKSRST
jgi:uncharacterized protein with predicted RNA binding PUA domain